MGIKKLKPEEHKTKDQGLIKNIKGSARNIARNTVRELFDVCVDTAKEKSSGVIESYEAKTQKFTSQLIHSEKEFLTELDKRSQNIIHLVFNNIDHVSNIIAARVLSILTTASLLYSAFQIAESVHTGKTTPLRVSITFFLLTVLIAGCLRVVRFAFDWRDTLKEFQRWQFITALVIGSGITSGIIAHHVIQYF